MNGSGQLGSFPATVWSLVARASGGGEAALQQLLMRYLPALRARLVLERRVGRDEADDLLQGFIADKMIGQELIGKVDRSKGKFRTFVLTALDRYAIDRARSQAAGRRAIPRAGTEELANLPAATDGPSRQFDLHWARQVIDQAVRQMESQCSTLGRNDLWELFRCRVLDPALAGVEPVPYERLLERFQFATPAAASNALVTAKRMFERTLRSVVGEYAGDESAIDQEIVDLRAIIAGQ